MSQEEFELFFLSTEKPLNSISVKKTMESFLRIFVLLLELFNSNSSIINIFILRYEVDFTIDGRELD